MKAYWHLLKLDLKQQAAPAAAHLVAMIGVVAWSGTRPDSPWPPALKIMAFLVFSAVLGSQAMAGGRDLAGDTLASRLPVTVGSRLVVRLLAVLVLMAVLAGLTLGAGPAPAVGHVPVIMGGVLALLSGVWVSFFLSGLTAALGALVLGGIVIGLARSMPRVLADLLLPEGAGVAVPFPYGLPVEDLTVAWGIALAGAVGLLAVLGIRQRPDRFQWRHAVWSVVGMATLVVAGTGVVVARGDAELDRELARQAEEAAMRLQSLPETAFRVPPVDPRLLGTVRTRDENAWTYLSWLDANPTLFLSELSWEQYQAMVNAGHCSRFTLPETGEEDRRTAMALSGALVVLDEELIGWLSNNGIDPFLRMDALLARISLHAHLEAAGDLSSTGVSRRFLETVNRFAEQVAGKDPLIGPDLLDETVQYCANRLVGGPFHTACFSIVVCAQHRAGFPALERTYRLGDGGIRAWIRKRVEAAAVQDIRYLNDAPGRSAFLRRLDELDTPSAGSETP